MSTHMMFHGEIRKLPVSFCGKKYLSGALKLCNNPPVWSPFEVESKLLTDISTL